jgi:ParB-like chromosome segregation protein Spo0J
MEILEVNINELKPSEYNPRKLTEKEKKDLIESLKRFNFVEPIVVNSAENRKNIIIGGHQRYYIAKELGYKTIPVVYVNIPDIKKEQELNLRLNKNLGEWDYDLLANFDENLLKEVGFEEEEIELKLKEINGLEEIINSDFDYQFGTINSWIRIGDFCCEIEDEKYQKIKKKIEEMGGLENFLNQIIQ